MHITHSSERCRVLGNGGSTGCFPDCGIIICFHKMATYGWKNDMALAPILYRFVDTRAGLILQIYPITSVVVAAPILLGAPPQVYEQL